MSEPVPFCGGSNELRRKKADIQRAINLMPTPLEAGQQTLYLAPVPGLRVFVRLLQCTPDGRTAIPGMAIPGCAIPSFIDPDNLMDL